MNRLERDRHVLRVNKLYTAGEIARVLMVREDFVNKLARTDAIPFVKLNGQRMYCGWQIREWLDKTARGMAEKPKGEEVG